MKIGVNTWVWTSPFSTKDFNLIPKIRQMGFDILEVVKSATKSSSQVAILRRSVSRRWNGIMDM